MHAIVTEYLRPWKLASFAVGLGLLLVGADYYDAPDWDYTISFIMATLTYLTAPWSVQVFKDKRWRWAPLALFCYYFAVDGSYWLYWRQVRTEALEMMREANFYASTCLYWLCGFIWLHRGPLRNLLRGTAAPEEALTMRRALSRIAGTAALFGTAFHVYSAATAEHRMTEVCRHITPGMGVEELRSYAERHGLGPRRNLGAQTQLAYLAEARTMGRHACSVELADGRVRQATYNFAD